VCSFRERGSNIFPITFLFTYTPSSSYYYYSFYPSMQCRHDFDEQADESLTAFLHTDGATVYTIIIPLNERDEHKGGQLYVRKDKMGKNGRPLHESESSSASRSGGSDSGSSSGGVAAEGTHGSVEDEEAYDEEDAVDVGHVERSFGSVQDYIHGDGHTTLESGGGNSPYRKASFARLEKASLDKLSDPHRKTGLSFGKAVDSGAYLAMQTMQPMQPMQPMRNVNWELSTAYLLGHS